MNAKFQKLIDSLNDIKGDKTLVARLVGNPIYKNGGITLKVKGTEDKITEHYFVKLRIVTNDEGVEVSKFVARDQKDLPDQN